MQQTLGMWLQAVKSHWKSSAVSAFILFFLCYFTYVMQNSGEGVFALGFFVVGGFGLWVYLDPKLKVYRLLYPALVSIFVFTLIPLIFTLGMSFTNYAASNQLSLNKVLQSHLKVQYQVGSGYSYRLFTAGDGYRLGLSRGNEDYLSQVFGLESSQPLRFNKGAPEPSLVIADLKAQLRFRGLYGEQVLTLPGGGELKRFSLSSYGEFKSKYVHLTGGVVLKDGAMVNDSYTLRDKKTDLLLRPNFHSGFYQTIDGRGQFIGNVLAPGFVLNKGTSHYDDLFGDASMLWPFLQVLSWTLGFAVLSLLGAFLVGSVLACLTSWPGLTGSHIYRTILLLPWAIPPFITILAFKALFHPERGEINQLLLMLFGLSPDWFGDPLLARLLLLLVSIWLGYPAILLLCLGVIKDIPRHLYEAAAIEGHGVVGRFWRLTLPLLFKPLKPVLVAVFALNLNNFVLVYLLTGGEPSIVGSHPVAGQTDLILNYVVGIAFEGEQNYALAAAVTSVALTFIVLLAMLVWYFLQPAHRGEVKC